MATNPYASLIGKNPYATGGKVTGYDSGPEGQRSYYIRDGSNVYDVGLGKDGNIATIGDPRQWQQGGVLDSFTDKMGGKLGIFGGLAGLGAMASLAGAGGAASGVGSAAPAASGGVGATGAGAGAAGASSLAAPAAAGTGASAAGGLLSGIPGGAGTALMAAGALGDLATQRGAPSAPDFTQAAQAQTSQQQQIAQDALNQNRYNESTPFGSRQWTRDAQGNWTSTTSLSPEQQALYDQDVALSRQYGQTAQSLLGNAQDTLSDPFSFTGSDRQRVEDQIYGGMTSRLDDRFGRAQSQLETRLANQGITPGSEAYTAAMRDFQYGQNDAYQQAMTQATGLGLNEAQNEFGRQLTQYNNPVNVLGALRGGSQATVPQFGAGAQMATTQAPNLMGAAQAQYGATADQYNADAARRSNFWGGLLDLGSTLYRFR